MKVVLLSGGVGGARFARGLVDVAGGENLTVVGNVGDDLEVLGMSVSPDLDSILYALAGLHDEERGWGRAGETWEALATVSTLGGEDWFRLGDRDLGLHLVRTQALRAGEPLSSVTARLASALGIEPSDPAGDRRPPPHVDRHAGRELRLSGVVRRPRPPRRSRRRPLRRRRRTPRRACSTRSLERRRS